MIRSSAVASIPHPSSHPKTTTTTTTTTTTKHNNNVASSSHHRDDASFFVFILLAFIFCRALCLSNDQVGEFVFLSDESQSHY
jgi:hypothetical protein